MSKATKVAKAEIEVLDINDPFTGLLIPSKITRGNNIGYAKENKVVVPSFVLRNVTIANFEHNARFKRTYLRVHLDPELEARIHALDETLMELAINDPRFKIMDGLLMTPRTWRSMFRPSATENHQLSINVNSAVTTFNQDGLPIENLDLARVMNQQTPVSIVVVPTCIWCFNNQAGVSWNLRQVRFVSEIVEGSPELVGRNVMDFSDDEY